MTASNQQPKGIEHGYCPDNAFDDMNAQEIAAYLRKEFHNSWARYCPSSFDIGGQIDWVQEMVKRGKLSDQTRLRFVEAVSKLFDEIAAGDNSWFKIEEHHMPASELVVFARDDLQYFGGDEGKDRAVHLHPTILTTLDGSIDGSTDNKIRRLAFDFLLDTGYSTDPEFWKSKVEGLPERVSSVFAMIAKTDPNAAFEYFTSKPWYQKNHSIVLPIELARIKDQHGAEVLDKGMARLRAAFPEQKHQLDQVEGKINDYTKAGMEELKQAYEARRNQR